MFLHLIENAYFVKKIFSYLLRYNKNTKSTWVDVKNGAEMKELFHFAFHKALEKLHLLRSFFHFS